MSRIPTEHDARHPALRDVMARHAPTDGASTTAIEGLVLYRHSEPTELPMALYEPSMCLLARGAKSLCLGEKVHHYGPMRHLVASLWAPTESGPPVAQFSVGGNTSTRREPSG